MENEALGKPVWAILRSTAPNEVSAPRGYCFGDRWFCSAECLEWGMGQEILQLLRHSKEKAMLSRPRIGALLLVKKWITSEQLGDALKRQRQNGKKLGDWLVKLGYLEEEKLIRALSEQMQIAWMSEIKNSFSEDAVAALPKTLCKRLNVFPLEYGKNSGLVLAVDFNFTDEMIGAFHEVLHCRVKLFMTRTDVLKRLIEEYLEAQDDNTTDVISERGDFAGQIGHKFVKRWFEFGAEKARFGLFEDTLWVRFLKGQDFKDHFMLFRKESVVAEPDTKVTVAE